VNENRVSSRDNLREEVSNNLKKLPKSVDKKQSNKGTENKNSKLINYPQKSQARNENKINEDEDEENQRFYLPNQDAKKNENFENNYDEEK